MHYNSSDWHYLIYYGILLSILVIGLFSRKDLAFSKVLKYSGIWLSIAFIIIVLYSFRHDFSHFKNRILGELNPSHARINENGQIAIKMSKNGHYYINAKINETPITFMIDTGATDISISLADAENIGINVQELHFNKRYQTANGVVLGAKTILKEMKIGHIKFRNIPASINSANMGVSLLGMSFLRQCRKYEFYQDTLILTF